MTVPLLCPQHVLTLNSKINGNIVEYWLHKKTYVFMRNRSNAPNNKLYLGTVPSMVVANAEMSHHKLMLTHIINIIKVNVITLILTYLFIAAAYIVGSLQTLSNIHKTFFGLLRLHRVFASFI